MENDNRLRTIRNTLLFVVVCSMVILSSCSRAALLDRAQSAWDSGDYEKSAEYYEEFLQRNPQSEQAPWVRFRVATICQRDLKQYDRAIRHFIHLIEDFPKSQDIVEARVRLAESYAATGKGREAISEYENVLQFMQDEKEKRRVRLNIADLYYDMNDLGQAVAEYLKVTVDVPYDELSERSYLRIGGIRLLRDEFDEAIPAWDTVAKNTADPVIRRVARFGLADCYERTFQYDKAVNVLENTDPDPKTPEYIGQRIKSIKEQQQNRNLMMPATKGWPGK